MKRRTKLENLNLTNIHGTTILHHNNHNHHPLLITFSLLATISTAQLDEDCNGRWIHIRNLPSKFNLQLLSNCSSFFPLFPDFCPYLSNHGLGPKTHSDSHSWYRTNPHLLELYFHRRLLEYPCLSQSPLDSNAIFLPYYSSLDSLRYLYGPDYNSSHLHGLDLYSFLQSDDPEIWRRNNGHDHFLIMASTSWDYSQPLPSYEDEERLWGTSFLMLPEFFNLTVLSLESRAWPWQEQAIPHPTSFHPSSVAFFDSWISRVRRSRRSTLMLFAGGGGTSTSGNPNVRRSIREECGVSQNSSLFDGTRFQKLCEIVDCSNGICEHDPIRYMKPMLQASFCLQPPGETPARRSTFDGILAGCIPVFFEDQSAKSQYQWHLSTTEFDEFSVTIPKEDVVFKGLKVVDVLMGIPKAEVRRMREKVMELIPRIMYRKHGSSLGLRAKKDAFDIAIEGTLQRIKDRLKDVSTAG
ncbi:putative xyloglucan galactosyltransferase GT19 [Bienertia sinuspersici]